MGRSPLTGGRSVQGFFAWKCPLLRCILNKIPLILGPEIGNSGLGSLLFTFSSEFFSFRDLGLEIQVWNHLLITFSIKFLSFGALGLEFQVWDHFLFTFSIEFFLIWALGLGLVIWVSPPPPTPTPDPTQNETKKNET